MGQQPSSDMPIEALRADAVAESSGSFGLDLHAAVAKLGKYLLPSCEDAWLRLVQFGVARGAAAIVFRQTATGIFLQYFELHEDRSPAELLAALPQVVAGGPDPTCGRVLCAGLHFFLTRGATLALSRWSSGELVDRAVTGRFPTHAAADARFPHVFSIEFSGAPADTFHPDLSALRGRLAFCSTLVSWGQEKLNAHAPPASWQQQLRREFLLDGKLRSLLLHVEVTRLVEQQRRDQAQVIPVQHGVALDALPVPAGAPGIRLTVPADDVPLQLSSWRVQAGSAWTARQPLIAEVVRSVSASVHTQARNLRQNHVLQRPFNPARMKAVRAFAFMIAVDVFLVFHRSLPSGHGRSYRGVNPEDLDFLAGLVPYALVLQIAWVLWQVR